ncbi:MAG: hypothetical protein CMN78_06315 [Spirochaetales bacterium]|nr:hypothetical protein [Spirochaetales bacterium]
MPPIEEDSITRPLEGEALFFFGIPEDINPEIFEGFEIYYRFYRVDDPALATMVGDENIATPATKQALSNAQYKRLHDFAYPPELLPELPLIPIARDDRTDAAIEISLDFGSIASTYPHSTYGDIQLSRLISSSASEPSAKGFSSSDFEQTDPDMPSGLDFATTSNVYISLYAMSYGNDISDFKLDIHSTAVYLGRILANINLP